MAENVLFLLHWGQLQAFEEAIAAGKLEAHASWKSERARAQSARQVEGLVSMALTIPDLISRHWQSTFDLASDGAIDDYREVGEELQASFDKGLSILRNLYDLGRTFEEVGHSVNRLGELGDAIEKVTHWKVRIFANWPWPDGASPPINPRMVEESRAAIARGEYQEVGEILRGLQDPHPQAN